MESLLQTSTKPFEQEMFVAAEAATSPLPALDEAALALAAIREQYRAGNTFSDTSQSVTRLASMNYLDRLAETDQQLRAALDEMGADQIIAGLHIVYGALLHGVRGPGVREAIITDVHDATINAFFTDALAIRTLGLSDPAAKAAFFAPDHYKQKPQPKPAATGRATTQPNIAKTESTPADEENSGASLDSFNQYMSEIRRHELLTPAQQKALAKEIEAGVFAQEKLDNKTLMVHNDYRRDLEIIADRGRTAKKQMIEANLRLVVNIALKHQRSSVPIMDMIEEGNLGLIRAVEKYDYTKGFTFSTYATNWIKTAVLTFRNEQSLPWRVPPDMHVRKNQISRLIENYQTEHDAHPSIETIAKETGLSPEQVRDSLKLSGYRYPSLNYPVGENGDELGQMLHDPLQRSVEDIAVQPGDAVKLVMETLFVTEGDAENAALLTLALGLPLNPAFIDPAFAREHAIEEGREYNLKEIAQMFGHSTKWVRSHLDKALARLNTRGVKRVLQRYLSA